MTERQKKLARANGVLHEEYERVISKKIRRRYSLSKELSLHRQKETKAEEFSEMCAYIEACIAEAKSEVYGNEA